MGCSGQKASEEIEHGSKPINSNITFIDDYLKAFKSIKTESFFKNNADNIKIELYLISIESIPLFIKLIEESKVLEYQNNEAYMEYFKKSLNNYEIEEDIKIYHKFEECKNLAGGFDQKKNQFIIVDKTFLYSMNIKENQNDFIIIIINNSKKPKEIFFPEEKLSLGCEPIKNGFYKFIILDHDNDSIEYNKNNNSVYDKMNINKEKNEEGNIIDKENSKKI